MDSIKFIDLIDVINKYSDKIEIIRDLDTNLYLDHVKKISNIGNIFVYYIDEALSENFNIIASGTIIIEPKFIRGGFN